MTSNPLITSKNGLDSGFHSLPSIDNNSKSNNDKGPIDMIYDTPYLSPQNQKISNGAIITRRSTFTDANKEMSLICTDIDIESKDSTQSTSDIDKNECNTVRITELDNNDKTDDTIENDCYATVVPKTKRLVEKSKSVEDQPIQPIVPERNYQLNSDNKEPIIECVKIEVEVQAASTEEKQPEEEEEIPAGGYGEYETFSTLLVNPPKPSLPEEDLNSPTKKKSKFSSKETKNTTEPPELPKNTKYKAKYSKSCVENKELKPPKNPPPSPPTNANISNKISSSENISDTQELKMKTQKSNSIHDISISSKTEKDPSKQKTTNKFLLFFKRMKIRRKSTT